MIFTVAPPPSDLKVYQNGPTKIKLTWSLPSHPSVTTGYRIVYSVAGGSSNSVEVDGGSNSYVLTGLLNGANYVVSFITKSQHYYHTARFSVPMGEFTETRMPLKR